MSEKTEKEESTAHQRIGNGRGIGGVVAGTGVESVEMRDRLDASEESYNINAKISEPVLER